MIEFCSMVILTVIDLFLVINTEVVF